MTNHQHILDAERASLPEGPRSMVRKLEMLERWLQDNGLKLTGDIQMTDLETGFSIPLAVVQPGVKRRER